MRTILCLAIVALCANPAEAQPRVTNGELRQAVISGALTRASLEGLARAGAAWVGYTVPARDGEHHMCASVGTTNPVPLEGSGMVQLLYRLEAGAVTRIRMFSDDCALDAGGLTVHWLNAVSPVESVAVLAGFINATVSTRLADSALAALGMHQEPTALDRLLTAARAGATPQIRGQALFWLAQRAGDKAVGAITDAIARDPETDVKKRAVFALSQLPRDEGVPRLIDVARTNANPAVRKQAMFWLGQTKDARALKFFEDILFK
ncbi:MAG: HEAT repeat domain-containing protein [Acidobacteria bacterium]|nr:HEAT repeat domain-containing protein [Acidobacteriota bacterium]